jgi:hypothetical protein
LAAPWVGVCIGPQSLCVLTPIILLTMHYIQRGNLTLGVCQVCILHILEGSLLPDQSPSPFENFAFVWWHLNLNASINDATWYFAILVFQ